MKIAILSDSHDNLPNIEKAIQYLNRQKITTIIHCGDVCSQETLQIILDKFNGAAVHLVNGNAEEDQDIYPVMAHNSKKLIYHHNTGKIDMDNLQITFCHNPFVAKKMAEAQKYDFIFYGHSHTPWQETIGRSTLINPGTLAGLFQKATFAVFDTQTKLAKLILLEKI